MDRPGHRTRSRLAAQQRLATGALAWPADPARHVHASSAMERHSAIGPTPSDLLGFADRIVIADTDDEVLAPVGVRREVAEVVFRSGTCLYDAYTPSVASVRCHLERGIASDESASGTAQALRHVTWCSISMRWS